MYSCQACMGALFSPEMFPPGAVKGLKGRKGGGRGNILSKVRTSLYNYSISHTIQTG